MKAKLSFVLPVLNNREGLRCAIESILVQLAYPVELIVIDGGSTDGTLEVINSYCHLISYFETGLDTGIADAFNRGIERATGDVIAILNSDDVLEPNAIGNVIDVVTANPSADVFYGSLCYFDSTRGSRFVRKPDLSSMCRRMSLFHPALFVRRSCYERVGLYDCGYTHAMDSEWCHRAMVSQVGFCEVPSVLATMSLGGVSDIEYRQSLQQYRISVIRHGLASSLSAYAYYYFYLTAKTVVRLPVLRTIKRIRDRMLDAKK